MLILKILIQFALTAVNPSWTCELTHREPGVAATMYMYCAKTLPDGTEVASIGKYVPDARHSTKTR